MIGRWDQLVAIDRKTVAAYSYLTFEDPRNNAWDAQR